MNWLEMWPIIAFVIVQTIAVVTALSNNSTKSAVHRSTTNSRLTQLEVKVAALDADHNGFRRDVNDMRVTLGRIEERLIAMSERKQ